ncbi:PfkB family carbohydrate kinase [Candidatus Magnetaquicoccus inordinatus]|uniref:PfkB family carbohydrate kinase n=1 Tax=Candidatus Magnetaquicoccus inordinatus TaxID=2496818 RepID=UPI00102B3096|nr:PfkB family carbohydrate kinase [Candidatus Magnetaquicoccus inordinatus]
MTDKKIVSLPELGKLAHGYREQGKKVVLCHGVFDLLHPGHMRHLQKAQELGDVLFVTVTTDEYVNKGPGRPVFTSQLRAESLAALACVGHVAINHAPTAVPVIHTVQPAIYVKGQDYKVVADDISGNISTEQEAVEAHGGRLCYTEEIQFSSSSIINDQFDVFSPATKEFLRRFKETHQAEEIIKALQSLQGLRVLVVGEAIVDEYCYVQPMGMVGKGVNVMACRYTSTEQFAGGSLAVANHLAGFVERIALLTGLGQQDPHEPFIRSKLAANIEPVFHYYESAPTLVKRRFVDENMNKLFELYFGDEEPMSDKVEEEICQWLAEHGAEYDLVIVPDYGNGLISPRIVEALSRHARYLAVNTQVNGGNRGYHVVTRYPRADFAAVNEPELRLAAHDRFGSLESLARRINGQIHSAFFAVTRGSEGALLWDSKMDRLHSIPALSTRVVDRVGAGDSFLAFASLALAGGLDPEISLFIGSVAAALDVQIVCNREPIEPLALYKYMTTLMK